MPLTPRPAAVRPLGAAPAPTLPLRAAPLPPPLLAPLLALALLLGAAAGAHAASPFGVGLPEPAPSAGGLLPGLFAWIAAEQSRFYRALTAAVSAMKSDGTAGVWLMGLSFAYGVLHAAGPGHGKAVVSAYVLANRETARNAALLSVLSALAQAATAIVLVSVAAVLLGATSIAMTEAARVFEIGSFALVAGLGAWLVHRKIVRPLSQAIALRAARPTATASALAFAAGRRDNDTPARGPAAPSAPSAFTAAPSAFSAAAPSAFSAASAPSAFSAAAPSTFPPGGRGPAGRLRLGRLPAAAGHVHGEGCGCEHGHVPDPAVAAGRLDLAKAWTTVLAVGLRPCTGALIVLVFALAQGLFAAGVAATVAMALGTGLTVAALTLFAVSARGLALRVAGRGTPAGRRVHAVVEGVGALVVLGFGILMLGASLAGAA